MSQRPNPRRSHAQADTNLGADARTHPVANGGADAHGRPDPTATPGRRPRRRRCAPFRPRRYEEQPGAGEVEPEGFTGPMTFDPTDILPAMDDRVAEPAGRGLDRVHERDHRIQDRTVIGGHAR